MAAGLAGCGKGNATGNTAGQAEQQAESTKEQKNQSQTEDTGKKDSVIVLILCMAGVQGNMFMNR